MKAKKSNFACITFILAFLFVGAGVFAQTAYVNYAEALQKSLFFYDAEKCNLTTASKLEWRGPCHLADLKLPLTSTMTNMSDTFISANRSVLDPDGDGYLNVSGGYHDAGDHVKFGLPQGYSASTLAWGMHEFKQAFIDAGQWDHALDILKYFTDYFLRSTFKNSSGAVVAFCYQVGEGASDHTYWGPPELQEYLSIGTTARPGYFASSEDPASDVSSEAAATLAIMSLLYSGVDATYAANCLATAKALYTFAVANRGIGYSGGFYGSSYDHDDLSWAATWLYAATGTTSYITDIMAQDASGNYTGYVSRIVINPENDWQNAWVHCWDTVWGGVFTKLATLFPDNSTYDYYSRWNIEYWSGGQIPHQSTSDSNYLNYTPGGYGMINTWGSCRYNTAAQLCGLVYAKSRGRTDIPAWAQGQMTYIMGANPLNRSYIVGYGLNPVQHPHHRAAHGSLINDMNVPAVHRHTLWGALAGGPDGSDYHNDVTTDYAYNEVAVDYNAAFVGALAGLYDSYGRAAGHLPLGSFPPAETGVIEYYMEAKINEELVTGINLNLKIHAEPVHPPRLVSGLSARYYFNISELTDRTISSITTTIYYDEQFTLHGGPATTISTPVAVDAAAGSYYIDISWANASFVGARELQFVIQVTQDYSGGSNPAWDGSNDYSHTGLGSSYVTTNFIPVYKDNILVWGTELAYGTTAPTTPPTETAAPTAVVTTPPVVTPDPTTPPSETPAPTDAPTATPAPTETPGPTSVPTATPAGVTAAPTTPPTDTIAPTTPPVDTVAPTTPPTDTVAPTTPPTDTAVPTTPPADTAAPTSPPVTGCTCTNLCTSQTAIIVPFTYDGSGEYCWTSSSLATYVNSWNTDAVNINGTNCTNTYVSSSSIAAISGVYYIYYKASVSWAHIEIK